MARHLRHVVLTVFPVCLALYCHVTATEGSTTDGVRRRDQQDTSQTAIPALNLLHSSRLHQTEAVAKLSPLGYKLREGFQGIVLPQANVTRFHRGFRGALTLRLTGLISDFTQTTLLAVTEPGKTLPYLEVTLDLKANTLMVRYLGSRSFQRALLTDVFSVGGGGGGGQWTDLQVALNGTRLEAWVDCHLVKAVRLRQVVGVIPPRAVIVFGARNPDQTGLQGTLLAAMLYNGSHLSSNCDQSYDQLVSDQPADESSDSVVLTTGDALLVEKRLLAVERQLAQLSSVVESLAQENRDFKSRVASLETCECVPSCSFEGATFQEGEMWQPEECVQCQCLNNKAACSRRLDSPLCAEPCLSSPCANNGHCLNPATDAADVDFQCECAPPYGGDTCQLRQNPCVWPAQPGSCDQEILRYYYDQLAQQCLPFMFSGCGGNVNNYLNLEECNSIAMTGACCYRTFSTEIGDVTRSTQQLEVQCQELHMVECKALHRQADSGNTTETEVISFNPGLTCQEAVCQTAGICVVGQTTYSEGDEWQLGCQKCTCKALGQITCQCTRVSVRKEVRDMSQEELMRFQRAVEKLRASEDRLWEQFRDMHMYHVMHATGGPFFLPWHRAFLRQLEQRLQEVDCDIVLPYFDFTTDTGFFEEAILWHPFFFGGNGDGGCVDAHPFGPANLWQPCIIRNFNTSIQLPSQVELMVALASDDFTEMSMCLEAYVAYVHNFIGGDMMTPSSPYDPVFYTIHAYIDMLYWTWQQRSQNKFKFPAAFGNIPMIPFNIPPWAVFDSEVDMCVTYALPSKGHPCNVTTILKSKPNEVSRRGDLDPDEAYGTNSSSEVATTNYSRIHLYGMGNGYNRDGYDIHGFDIGGFDRYGFNANGFDRYGYNVLGVDSQGNMDTTGRFDSTGYDLECLNREGLTNDGLDQYGFFKSGLDVDSCSFYFLGPYSPLHSHRIHTVLSKQPKRFLMEVARTCTQLSPLPSHWLSLNWVTSTKDVTKLVPVHLPNMQTAASSRFCFDTKPYLTSCACDEGIAECRSNPCFNVTCQAFPEAQCRTSFCGVCSATWYFQGKKVDCDANRDHCDPNPCLNGGICLKSIWPQEAHHMTCQCPPGFEGHLCQHAVTDPCNLPLRTGTCDAREERWHFNFMSGQCERFFYLGCGGNANNFVSLVDCQNRCLKGSCCSRQPAFRNQEIGFDSQGYDKYGFNMAGFNRFGEERTIDNGFQLGRKVFDENGYDWQGFDRGGFGGEDKLNRAGYDKDGYDAEGFNITGFSRNGEYDGIIDYDQNGFDAEGYNRAGLSCHGNDRQGFDLYGVSGKYKYACEVTSRIKCQELAREGIDVIKFTPGKTCEEAPCEELCGCRHGNNIYGIHEKFRLGCQSCVCTESGHISCECDFAVERKELRELSQVEKRRYQNAIKQLAQDTSYPSEWHNFASMYASHKPQAVGNPLFLPWHRQFLRHVEQALQRTDCKVTIPYYDWTVDAGQPQRSLIWGANLMGGDGDNDNECVQYHPFKSYHPPYLAPCLRRRFNASVSLPSAVNVEMALREPSYDKFRIQIELFAHLFQSFVGGHMNTDYAPYDPLFYSLMAYVDKLWMTWQDLHPQGISAFPLTHRFAKLSPFKSMPDDLFDSRLQLCVDYIPLLEGADCNETEFVTLGFNRQGYDRHGYNQEGFDRDGYNVRGLDRAGNFDDRNIYNVHGFDREGYDRSGHDSSGMDRYGYFTDSYNLDGFDANGYDRSGYNRYGFDQQRFTPYGYNINGSVMPNVDISELDLFDSFGYNKYGYDQQGFDRNGFDVFGFNARGYDERICNKYFRGPIHIIVRVYASRVLADLNTTMLTNVKRICPQLTPFTPDLLKHYWFNRRGQIAVVKDVYEYHLDGHSVDLMYLPREGSVTSDLIWLPIAPDEHMCFVTEIFTHCQPGEPNLMCPRTLCQGQVCPGHPTALCRVNSCGRCGREWYDGLTGALLKCSGCLDQTGQVRRENEMWPDGFCSNCFCREGEINCRPVLCPEIDCQYPVLLPDQCCPSCDGCDYDGQIILSGSDFQVEGDPCSRCRCMNGNVRCSNVECPDLGDCQSRRRPEGQCCDLCLDCGDRIHGDIWRPNPCQNCACQGGQVECTETVCEKADCLHPYTRPGQCCPQCSACLYKGNLLENGETFSPRPCDQCTCVNGSVQCDTVICGRVRCSNPVTPPGQCCPACGLDCEYEDQRYLDQTVFHPSYNPCLNCTCSNSIVRCQRIGCPPLDLPCTRPIRLPGQCCPSSCPVCEDHGYEYEEGETWPSHSSPCDACQCLNGAVICQPQLDCQGRCIHGTVKPGECCSRCEDCLFEGQILKEGEKTVLPGDVCRQCVCRSGNMVCDDVVISRECPRLGCRRTEFTEGNCCPVCAGCMHRGVKFAHGDVISKDECSECSCVEGEVQCVDSQQDCPIAQCLNPKRVPGQCCPVCEDCLFFGREYVDGQNFTSSRDPCQHCLCQAGQVQCRSLSEDCPTVPCAHPGRRQGQCCPHCDQCFFQRRSLKNGQRFIGKSPCEICVCKDGSVACTDMKCPQVECSNPTVKPGRCCPSCDGICVFQGREFQDGQTFPNPASECSSCTCEDGRVQCDGEGCEPTTTCQHPATLPGDCCPSCNFCAYQRRIFRNQQRFMNPQDVCQHCSCQFGTVTCTAIVCDTLNCLQPVSMPGSCCPICPKQCSHGGYYYDDGETFVNSQNKCEDCLCRQGVPQCKARMCPRVSCDNPVSDGCCQVCSDCQFGNLILRNGQQQENPDDPCQLCECRSGSVQCRSVQCPEVSCSNPVVVGCCPECHDCEYRGRRHDNGALITEADRCQTCHCQEGNVYCRSDPCPVVSCKHPARGQCCEECDGCFYQDRSYRDGERFADANTASCQDCICSMGDVMCSPKVCPAVTCTHPSPGVCCEECTSCMFQGQLLRDGAVVESRESPCQECRCQQGSVSCHRKECPGRQLCRHPVVRDCCPQCSDCSYRGREYRNRQDFSDPSSQCVDCHCSNGEVNCRQRPCPKVACANPVQGDCCLECARCSYDGRTYADGQRFPNATDRCQECVCSSGDVRCSPQTCPQARQCSHPVTLPGSCCPECGGACFYNNRFMEDGAALRENCQECVCDGGNVLCQSQPCPNPSCTHPTQEGCCPSCTGCQATGIKYRNGQTFPELRDLCSQCVCRDGSITCGKRPCPNALCSHPVRNECCDECIDCQFNGRQLFNGQRVNDVTDPCSECLCEYGSVRCSRKQCTPVSCRNAMKDECGCPTCRGCSYNGWSVPNGETFPSSSDECQECLCRSGTIECRNKECERRCSHPVKVSGCCPQCDDCLFEGRVMANGEAAVSATEPCRKCQCQTGSVVCRTLDCPEVPCLNPVTVEGECCPSCPLCVFFGQTYRDNQRFQHPEDSCQTCSCKMGRVDCESERCAVTCTHPRKDLCCPKCDDCFFEDVLYTNGLSFQPDACRACLCKNGNVACEEQTCPKLPCARTKKEEGQCCDVCQGCTFHGILYDENASWVLPDNPCVSCTCGGGLVTCMQTECFVPCSNPITQPGQCCPVCPTCSFDGQRYSDGQDFTPNGDPCDRCHCDQGNMRCVHDTCPSLVNCPPGSLRDPLPGQCCPTCASALTAGCSAAEIGQITRPRPNDPCLYCECKEDFMWVCQKEECPRLACPPDDQIHAQGQCCPTCPACFDVSQAKFYNEGNEWSAAEDPCIACNCRNGEIQCSIKECPAITCKSSETAMILSRECCESCQPVPNATCFYENQTHQPGDTWTVDECTSCHCLGGHVTCSVRQCPYLDCASDEAPTTVPAQCCPVCLKRPGTCLVFGDPHYQTFDGATLHFQGTCKYIMAADCENDLFRVEVQHDNRGARGEVSWAQNFTITVAGVEIQLLQNNLVTVNGKFVDIPYLYEPHVLIEISGKSIVMSTEIGMRVLWDGSSYGQVTVPGQFKRKMCGLCGNFNGFPQDDLRTKSGLVTNSPATFGNSWKAPTQIHDSCQDASDANPCVTAGYRVRKLATAKCTILKSQKFSRCHRMVPPEPFFSSCVYDLCVCLDNPDCLCEIVAAYAHECARRGVKVPWRSNNLCAFECDASKGLVFDECGPVCSRTCESFHGNANVTHPNSESQAQCFKPCVASCQCTADKVLHDGRCISPSECPDINRVPFV